MRSPLALGTVVVTGLASAGLVLLVAPDGGRAEQSSAPTAPDPVETVRTFWAHAVAGECSEASALMWWPVDADRRRRAYAQTCDAADLPASVEVGQARTAPAAERPYGASDLVSVPVELRADDGTTSDLDLQVVAVDGGWFVIR